MRGSTLGGGPAGAVHIHVDVPVAGSPEQLRAGHTCSGLLRSCSLARCFPPRFPFPSVHITAVQVGDGRVGCCPAGQEGRPTVGPGYADGSAWMCAHYVVSRKGPPPPLLRWHPLHLQCSWRYAFALGPLCVCVCCAVPCAPGWLRQAKRSRGMGVVGSTSNILDFIASKVRGERPASVSGVSA